MELSLTRLWLLIKKRWIDHQKMYLLGILAMPSIMLAIYLLNTSPDFSKSGLTLDIQGTFFFIGLLLFGGVFTSTLFNQFAEKPTGIHALMVPASTLEKIITVILYSNIFFPVIYLLFIYPTLVFAHYVDVQIVGNLNLLFDFKYDIVWGFVIVSYLVLNISLLGSILFRRYTFIKTAIVVCIVLFGSFYLNQKMALSLIGGSQPKTSLISPKNSQSTQEETDLTYNFQNAVPFFSISFFTSDRPSHISVRLEKRQTFLFNFFIYGFVIVMLWFATWFRLQEKQV